VAVVAVADSKVREHLLLLRFDPDFGVAEDHEEVVIGDGPLVSLHQVVALLVGQRHDQPLLF